MTNQEKKEPRQVIKIIAIGHGALRFPVPVSFARACNARGTVPVNDAQKNYLSYQNNIYFHDKTLLLYL
jgi:hypothetical protein